MRRGPGLAPGAAVAIPAPIAIRPANGIASKPATQSLWNRSMCQPSPTSGQFTVSPRLRSGISFGPIG
ncbi:hypothetical protein J2X01_001071 [Arthrobacter ginsengisoli]|uniref:Uncharacterized protein n=1 Tax=Arthrobacter ginsengisoli TaxID=1356565 RepID=A0ABU1U9J6_9MICC|nr:hypothetical protein [Arthrobacter ginsengisoli]